MTTSKRISASFLAVLLIASAGAAVHHIYETHLSSGYAPILRATLQSSHLEERAQYIHEARVAVRTDKDREVEAKLEKLQDDVEENISSACRSLQYTADDEQQKFNRVQAAYERGGPGKQAAYAVIMSSSTIKANDAVLACIAADEKVKHEEVGRLWPELCTDAGIPADR
jgi:hypothetical protein